jgi:hypothetical protein
MGKDKLTREQMIQLNVTLVGIPKIGMPGLMQYEDRSENYSLTLKLMKLVEKVAPEQKAWEQINKITPKIDEKDKNFNKLNGERDKKMNDYLDGFSGITFNHEEKISFDDLDNLWHPEDAKKKKEDIDKDGRRKLTGATIMSLQPILDIK